MKNIGEVCEVLGGVLLFSVGEDHLHLMDAALEAVDLTVEDDLALVEKCGSVAQLVDLLEIVGRDDHGQLTLAHGIHQHALDDDAHCGVESVEGLIQQQIGCAAGNADDHDRLTLHALGIGTDLAVGGQLDGALQSCKDLLGEAGIELLVEIFQLHEGIAAELHGLVVDEKDLLLGGNIIINGFAVDQHLAAIGTVDAAEEAKDGGFTGTVGAEQTEGRTLWDLQIDAVEGIEVPEFFDRSFECHHVVCSSFISGFRLSSRCTSMSRPMPARSASKAAASNRSSMCSCASSVSGLAMKLPRPASE